MSESAHNRGFADNKKSRGVSNEIEFNRFIHISIWLRVGGFLFPRHIWEGRKLIERKIKKNLKIKFRKPSEEHLKRIKEKIKAGKFQTSLSTFYPSNHTLS
jgi:hypothetical protein